MRTSLWVLGLSSALLAAACGGTQEMRSADSSAGSAPLGAMGDDEDDGEEEDEQEIALSEVPEAVKQAALAAVPGLVLESAERETERGSLVYCLEGTADGEDYEVEVTAAGKVTEIEHGEEDDEEDEDGDEDD